MLEMNLVMSSSLALLFEFAGVFVWQTTDARTITSLSLSQGSIPNTGEQALGSNVMAILVVNAPPATVPWEIDWILHDKNTDHILGTISLSALLITKFQPLVGGSYEKRVSVGISPSILSSPNDEIRSVVTFHDLHFSETGFRLGIFGASYPHQYTTPLNVTECTFTVGKAKITQPIGLCGFNCLAEYDCDTGYVATNSYVAQCMANSRWNLTANSCIENKLDAWELTPPSPRNIYAVGYTDFMIYVKINIAGIDHCAWQYNDGEWDDANFFDRRICTEEYLVGTKETVSCFTESGFLFSNLTFKKPLSFGKMSMAFTCHSAVFFSKEISVLYCPPAQGRAVITHKDQQCGYNCKGTYSCLFGLISLNRKPVVCTVTADWNITSANCVPDLLQSWETFPQDVRNYAVGFEGLIINIKIDVTSLGSCVWKYGGELDNVELMRPGGGLCKKRILAGVNETVTCYNQGGLIASNLTFHEPLVLGSLHVTLLCDTVPYLDQFIAARYCSTRQDYAVIKFASGNCGFNCRGFYECPTGFDRFGTDRVVCTAIAKWNITKADCILTDTEVFAANFNMTDSGGPGGALQRCNTKTLLAVMLGMHSTLALLHRVMP